MMKKKVIIIFFLSILFIVIACSERNSIEDEDISYNEQLGETLVNFENDNILNEYFEIPENNIKTQQWQGERMSSNGGNLWLIRRIFIAEEEHIERFMIQYPQIDFWGWNDDEDTEAFRDINLLIWETLNLLIWESSSEETGWEAVISANPAINLVFLVSYRIEHFTDDVLSITFHLYRSSPAWASSTSEEFALTIDLEVGEILTLADITNSEHIERMFDVGEYRLIGDDPTGMSDFFLAFTNALDEETTDRFYLTDGGEVCVIINSMTLPDATICIPLDYE